MFVKLHGRLAVAVGAGEIAAGKIQSLLQAGASVRRIARKIRLGLVSAIRTRKIEWGPSEFAPGDLNGAALATAATSVPGVNARVFREAHAQGIFCNAMDDMENCQFYYGWVVPRGDLQIAISTNGISPTLARGLRQELQRQFRPEYELWLAWWGAARELLPAADGGTESTSKPMYEQFAKEATKSLKVSSQQGVS